MFETQQMGKVFQVAQREKAQVTELGETTQDMAAMAQEANHALIVEEGLDRQLSSQQFGLSITQEIIGLYRDFRTGTIDKSEFADNMSKLRDEVRKNISNQFYDLYVNESGTSGQKIQLLKGIGIITYDGIDWQELSDKKPVSAEARACDRFLQKMLGLIASQSRFEVPNIDDQSSVQQRQEAMRFVCEVCYQLNEISYLNKDPTLGPEKLSEYRQLTSNLRSYLNNFFHQYTELALHLPSNYEALLIHTGLTRQLQASLKELPGVREAAAAAVQQATQMGLRRNIRNRFVVEQALQAPPVSVESTLETPVM